MTAVTAPPAANPLLGRWSGPFGLAPFAKITQAHFGPAFKSALAGHKAEALQAGEQSLALRETALDAVSGPYYKYQVARIYIMAGQYDRALDLIEPLVAGPGDLTPGWLRIDPIFAPLRGNPRFDRLTRATNPTE